MFGYKARVNHMFLNISRLLKIIERELNELLLLVKNLQELSTSPVPYIAPCLPYIAPIIPCPLLGESVKGEHFVLIDLLKSIPDSSSYVGFAREPQVDIFEGAFINFVRPDQSPLGEQESQPAPQAVKRKKAKKVGQIKATSAGLVGLRGLSGSNL